MDIMGPQPLSNGNNRYVLVIQDYFSKWVEAYPLPDQDAETVAQVFVEQFVSHWGVPMQIHTDQGSNFESKLFHELCNLLGIDKTLPFFIPNPMEWWKDTIQQWKPC